MNNQPTQPIVTDFLRDMRYGRCLFTIAPSFALYLMRRNLIQMNPHKTGYVVMTHQGSDLLRPGDLAAIENDERDYGGGQ